MPLDNAHNEKADINPKKYSITLSIESQRGQRKAPSDVKEGKH
jgi:hypothetical protein